MTDNTKKISPPLVLTPDEAHEYRRLRGAAIAEIRQAPMSEEAYDRLWGLLPLSAFMHEITNRHEQPLNHEVETWFAAASRRLISNRVLQNENARRYTTLNSLLGVIEARKERIRNENILGRLEGDGARIQKIAGCLVLTDPDKSAIGPGGSEKKYEARFAPKTKELVLALQNIGIFADDLLIYTGIVLPTMMRKTPYTLFEIPRIGRQIAICDQIGEVTFVAKTILPVSEWAALRKSQLKARPDVKDIAYNRSGKWLSKLRDELLDSGSIQPQSIPKVALPRTSKKQLLTAQQIEHWIKLYFDHEKELTGTGQWPTSHDAIVWDRNPRTGAWIAAKGENWKAIDAALHMGYRGLSTFKGSSLAKFKEECGLKDDNILTPEKIERWIKLFYEHEKETEGTGKWPTTASKIVWGRNPETDGWIEVKGETWGAINAAFREGLRGLSAFRDSSLLQFREERGLKDDNILTPEKIERWTKLFYEHEKEPEGIGRWPTTDDKIIWDRDPETGVWIDVKGETWMAIDAALREGLRGLAAFKGSSLAKFKGERGLKDGNILTPEKIERWTKLFYEHEKETTEMGRWPFMEDITVWDRDPQTGDWVVVQNETWVAINAALHMGHRGLSTFKGSSLAKFKEERRLKDDNILTPEKIERWIKLFYEHEKEIKGTGKWPSANDTIVWDRASETGVWIEVKGENWAAIHMALHLGFRGLSAFKGSTLATFKKSHGFHPT